MEATIVQWLSDFGTQVFFWSLGIFVVVNGVAAIVYLVRRDRTQVNRWTSRILAADLLLVGAGVGVPIVTTLTKLTVNAISAAFGGSGMPTARGEAVELEQSGK